MRIILLKTRFWAGLTLCAVAIAALCHGPIRALSPRSDFSPWAVRLVTPSAAKLLSLGHEEMAADWYWFLGLQYYAAEVNRADSFKELHRYLDQVNLLDPEFRYAYQFGGVAVPYHQGKWKWANVPESNAILSRGLERSPENWKLLMQLGFNKGIISDDQAGAGEAFGKAARQTGAPTWLSQLAARMMASAGDLEAASVYCQSILAATDRPEIKASMRKRLLEIESERGRRSLQGYVERFTKEKGAPPDSLTALLSAGYLQRLPPDPLGGSYFLTGANEVVSGHLNRGTLDVHQNPEGHF